MARQGAILTPSCLVILDEWSENVSDHTIRGITEKSRHGVWRGRSYDVNAPKSWLRSVLFSNGLLPYLIGSLKDAILPLGEDGSWLPERHAEKWWCTAQDVWRGNRGSRAPETLELQMGFAGKIRSQFPAAAHTIVYNSSGSSICAARMLVPHLMHHKLYRVSCSSEGEALFLTAILNADAMQCTFRTTRKSDRDFSTHFWYGVPIPRFNTRDSNHTSLAELARRAEVVAAGVERPTRRRIRTALREDGVSSEIDNTIYDMGLALVK